jgi:hypothetical protein
VHLLETELSKAPNHLLSFFLSLSLSLSLPLLHQSRFFLPKEFDKKEIFYFIKKTLYPLFVYNKRALSVGGPKKKQKTKNKKLFLSKKN